jgi:hypothetical protein
MRIWQVYWAQLGLVLTLVALAAILDRWIGLAVLASQFAPLLSDPEGALLGLVTLTWQPDYLDILPMYLVILGLVPVAMALRHVHKSLPFLMVALLYALVWMIDLNLPGNPWTGAGWFLNPFAWQLIFFLGFFFGMGWLRAPQLGQPRLMWAAALFLLLSVPLSFWGILEHWPAMQALRDHLLAGSEKSNLHMLRVVHFLALAYLVLSLIEPYRKRLDSGAGHLLILIGRQSLAAFLASVVFARLAGTIADMAGRTELSVALTNLVGFAAILGVAIVVGWFKSAPWSGPAPPAKAVLPAHDEPSSRMALPTRVREAS